MIKGQSFGSGLLKGLSLVLLASALTGQRCSSDDDHGSHFGVTQSWHRHGLHPWAKEKGRILAFCCCCFFVNKKECKEVDRNEGQANKEPRQLREQRETTTFTC